MTSPTRTVFDCNTYLQALASPDGPAGACFEMAVEGRLHLFISPQMIDELRDVASRPRLVRKFGLTTSGIDEFAAAISAMPRFSTDSRNRSSTPEISPTRTT